MPKQKQNGQQQLSFEWIVFLKVLEKRDLKTWEEMRWATNYFKKPLYELTRIY